MTEPHAMSNDTDPHRLTLSRREFLKTVGLGSACALLGLPGARSNAQQGLGAVKFRDGRVVVRLQISAGKQETTFSARLSVSDAKIADIRHYFFEPTEDTLTESTYTWTSRLTPSDFDVVVLWLDSARLTTTVTLKQAGGSFSFGLKQLLDAGQLNRHSNGVTTTANFLYDKEIGSIDTRDAAIEDPGDDFDFIIFADPQGGDPDDKTNDSTTRIRLHNPVIERNVELVNKLPRMPAFTMVVGDIVDSQGQKSNYDVVLAMLKKLKTPVLFELGNHETRYSSRFSPAYNMAPFDNYFNAQKQINGLDKLAYSFDLGNWHFVVWPDPLRRDFWPTHPHYFEWLANDLKANKNRPTILFQHVSLMPLGIDPMIAYSEKIPVKTKLLDIITRYGNVRYVFSGHTHIPIRSSIKTARTYKNVKFINLPPAGYRPRAFGESDFDNEPSQGFAIVSIKGETARVAFRNINSKTYDYPAEFPEFDPSEHPQWLTNDRQLRAGERIVNGDFESGLKGWKRRFVYEEDSNSTAVCRISTKTALFGSKSLYLYCRRKEAVARGQDRLPQTINRISQAVRLKSGRIPVLRAAYRLNRDHYHPNVDAGACIWLRGFNGSHNSLNLVYWVGKAISSPQGLYGRQPRFAHFDITAKPGDWRQITMNIADDYDRTSTGPGFQALGLDTLVVTLGAWTDNVAENAEIGLYFDGLQLTYPAENALQNSTIDDKPIGIRDKSTIWRKSIVHIDGEHVYKDRS